MMNNTDRQTSPMTVFAMRNATQSLASHYSFRSNWFKSHNNKNSQIPHLEILPLGKATVHRQVFKRENKDERGALS